jgi:hypothetical protein
VINFGEHREDECRQTWPALMDIVERKVRPERAKNNREIYKKHWWQYGEKRIELYLALAGLPRALAISRVSQHASIAFLPTGMVYSDSLIVFPLDTYAAFAALQSRPHELWARFFGSSLEDRLRYTPSDVFETFPFPAGWRDDARLEAAGRAYYEFRAALMLRNDQGLTATYNRFHDPDERDADIAQLRARHAAMDRAVLDAYGWSDIPTDCEFLLDYDDDDGRQTTDDGAEPGGRRAKKKPWRLRWPDAVRDEVLARLLALNGERAAGDGKKTTDNRRRTTKKRSSAVRRPSSSSEQGQLGV